MKTTLVSLVLLALSTAFAGAGEPANVYDLQVDGLGCPFCAYGLEKSLSAIPGIDGIDVDIDRGVAVVTMVEGAALDEAVADDAVERAGFTLRGIELEGPPR